jgi:hypothetical protein
MADEAETERVTFTIANPRTVNSKRLYALVDVPSFSLDTGFRHPAGATVARQLTLGPWILATNHILPTCPSNVAPPPLASSRTSMFPLTVGRDGGATRDRRLGWHGKIDREKWEARRGSEKPPAV